MSLPTEDEMLSILAGLADGSVAGHAGCESCTDVMRRARVALLAVYDTRRWRPDWAVHPGEFLQEELDARCRTQAAFADSIGCAYQHVNRVCRGHVRIEAPFALRLESALGISAEFWLIAQAAYDLHTIRAAERPESEAVEQ